MKPAGVTQYLNSDDPLTREAALFLVGYKEEDNYVDYKLEFDLREEKHWLGITKDVSAFANTLGGYLVFGVADKSREVVGLPRKVAEEMENVNNIQQKLNRYLDPELEHVRSKKFRVNGKYIVLMHIPQSRGRTHIISKDGTCSLPSGKKKTLLRKGTFYVRRSGSNHLGDSRDLDSIVERRIDHFRDALIDKVARVVKAPTESEVFILTQDPSDMEAKRFIISDAPESIPIRGMNFALALEGPEEEIAACSVLEQSNSTFLLPAEMLWKWYSIRNELNIQEAHRLSIFKLSLWRNAPSCYWVMGLSSADIQKALFKALKHRPNNDGVRMMLVVASLFGRSVYAKSLKALGSYREKLAPRQKSYPTQDPKQNFCGFRRPDNLTEAKFKKEKLKELNDIAKFAASKNREPGMRRKWRAQKIDCYLYYG